MFRVVVIAASAGGLKALSDVLGRLPGNFPVPLAVVQHVQSGRDSLLATILGRRTALVVKQAAAHQGLVPGTVYVAPPGHHLVVATGPFLDLADSAPVRFLRPCADLLFQSAARVYGDGVVGVVLTGSGTDGTVGASAIKMSGGVVIAQDTASSAFPSMPASAAATGAVDFVLPLAAIAGKLVMLTGAAAA